MDIESFKNYLEKRESASTAFVEGDVQPLFDVSTVSSPATIFGPAGTVVSGVEAVNAKNAEGARLFEQGSENSFEIIHFNASETLAYWTGIQHSRVKMKSSEELVPMDLRVTEIFRKENGEWKLVHRHADMLKADS